MKDLQEQKQDPIIQCDIREVTVLGPLHQEGEQEPSDKVGTSGKIKVANTTISFQEMGVSMQNTTVILDGDIMF